MGNEPKHEDALALFVAGAYQACAELCEHQLQFAPTNAQVWARLGQARQALGQWPAAQTAFVWACAHEPNSSEFQHNLALTYAHMGESGRASAAYAQAHRMGMQHPLLFNNWGCALRDGAQISAALDVFAQGMAHAQHAEPSTLGRLHTNLGATLCLAGQSPLGLEHLNLARQLAPQLPEVHANWLLAAHYSDVISPLEQQQHARMFGRALAAQLSNQAILPRHRDPEGALHIGLLSADFRDHPVARFVEPLLRHRGDGRMKFIAYADVAKPDDTSLRLQALVDHWRPSFGVSDESLRQQMQADNIDILVDLAGHTNAARTSFLCSRAAFAQVNYLGYPGTTGLPNIDFRIVDELTDPPGSEAHCSEVLLHMPNGFLCYGATHSLGSVAPQRRFTFGCFNNPAKISDTCLRLWAAILHQVPDSRLVLKAKVFSDVGVVEALLRRAEEQGLPSGRVMCWQPQTAHGDHMAAYREIDVALDTFPYHGTTTTCEALASGVPVVSLVGAQHVSRVGLSILSRVHLHDLATQTETDYVGTAVVLARDSHKREQVRQHLLSTWPQGPLTNGPSQAKAFEQVLREAWQRRLAAV